MDRNSLLPPVLVETSRILVIDKPAGLAVHPGPRTPESLEDLLPRYQAHGAPQPAHRLDRDTSGCLMLGRTRPALRRLMALFADGKVAKTYWALVGGVADSHVAGTIDLPLAKSSSRAAGWRMIVADRGQPARTRYEVIDRRDGIAFVIFHPETGRTHQIRVHATALGAGAAIVGDPVYGRAHPHGMMLHARALRFTDPWDEQTKTAEAPCPGRFVALGFGG